MTRSKITALIAAIALLAPAAPAAALNRVCLTVNTDNYGFTRANYKAKIHVQKLSRDQVWAAAWLDFVENFRFLDIRGAGYPEVESRTSELAVGRRVGVSHADADACVNVSDMLSEGDLFRLRIETEYGASSVCVHNLENDSDIFGDAPHFFLTSTGRGEDLYVKTAGTVGHPECLYSHGYQRTPLACVHESILMPGCRWRGPGNDDRVQGWAQDTIQYITGGGGHAGPYGMAYRLLMGDDPNMALSGGDTLLHLAADRDDNNYTKYLLRAGALQRADSDGKTPLHLAIESGRAVRAQMLTASENDGDINTVLEAQDGDGMTPFHLAVAKRVQEGGMDDIMRIFFADQRENNGHMTIANSDGATPMHTATEANDSALVSAMIRAGSPPTARHTETDETPLDLAVRLGHVETESILLAANAPRNTTTSNNKAVDAVDENGRTALHRAAAISDTSAVITALRRGASPNIRDNDGATALILAFKEGHADPGRYLLTNNNPDLSLADNNGDTALHWAARRNMHRIVSAMLNEAGADDSQTNNRGETPLDVAVRGASLEVAAVLILRDSPRGVTTEADNPADGKDENGDTPLHLAVAQNDPERIEWLMQLRPNLELGNRQNETPLLLAVRLIQEGRRDDKVVAPLLTAGASPIAAANGSVTPLHRAAFSETMPVLEAALAQEADLNLRDGRSATPLHWALRNREKRHNNAAIEFLLENGADPTLADRDGVIPIHDAAKAGDVNVINAAVALDANLDVRDGTGATPLHWAIRSHKVYAARALLGNGADPLLRDSARNFAALHWAADVNNEDAIDYLKEYHPDLDLDARGGHHNTPPMMLALNKQRIGNSFLLKMLQHGGDAQLADRFDRTPLVWTLLNDEPDPARILLQNGADPDFETSQGRPVVMAARHGNLEILEMLIDAGADFTLREGGEDLAEDVALDGGHTEVIEALHEAGHEFSEEFIARMRADEDWSQKATDIFGPAYDAELNERNPQEGKTQLHYAAQYQNVESLRDLLRRGADPHIRSNNGSTPMMTSIKRQQPNNVVVVRILLEAGTDPDEGDDEGNTPLSWAARTGQTDVAEALLEHGATVNNDFIPGTGYTPLHLASKSSPRIVELLVRAGMNVDITDRRGYTPMHWALDPNNPDKELAGDIVTELLNLNADPYLPDPDGNDLVDMAVDGNFDAAAAVLRVNRRIRERN